MGLERCCGVFEADGVRLFNLDCVALLKLLSDGSVDLALIDPPYQVSRPSNFKSGEPTGRDTDRFRVSLDFGDWDKKAFALDKVIDEIYRVLKTGGSIICFYDVWKITELKRWFELAGFKQIRLIEWLKTNPVPINSKINYLTNAREVAVLGVKHGKPVFNSSYDAGVYKFPICRDAGRFHPTQKPLALIEALVKKHSNAGDLILDCFSGSGTTAMAALKTGRKFIGCEMSAVYWSKSVKRIIYELANAKIKGGV